MVDREDGESSRRHSREATAYLEIGQYL